MERRSFLKGFGAAAACAAVLPHIASAAEEKRPAGPNEMNYNTAVAAITAVALVFAYVILPNMDSASDNSSVQIENPGTHDQDNDSPDSAITTSSVPSVENLAGSYSADGSSVQFTWVNPDPQDGDSYAWSLVGDAGVDPNAQGTTTTDTRISIKPADGSQTCIQVSLIRADRQMSQNPAIACAAKP